MMKPLIDFGKQAIALTSDVQKSKADIKDLREEIKAVREDTARLREDLNQTRLEFKDVLRVVERLAYDGQRERDQTASERAQAETERRLFLMEIENRFLRFERQLPPPPRSKDAPQLLL